MINPGHKTLQRATAVSHGSVYKCHYNTFSALKGHEKKSLSSVFIKIKWSRTLAQVVLQVFFKFPFIITRISNSEAFLGFFVQDKLINEMFFLSLHKMCMERCPVLPKCCLNIIHALSGQSICLFAIFIHL